jgi:hypothetical protein
LSIGRSLSGERPIAKLALSSRMRFPAYSRLGGALLGALGAGGALRGPGSISDSFHPKASLSERVRARNTGRLSRAGGRPQKILSAFQFGAEAFDVEARVMQTLIVREEPERDGLRAHDRAATRGEAQERALAVHRPARGRGWALAGERRTRNSLRLFSHD